MTAPGSSARRSAPGAGRRVAFHPLTPDRWDDLETLFGPRGAYAGCWCMSWRLKRAELERGQGEGNRLAMKAIVEAGPPPGILGYADTAWRLPIGARLASRLRGARP